MSNDTIFKKLSEELSNSRCSPQSALPPKQQHLCTILCLCESVASADFARRRKSADLPGNSRLFNRHYDVTARCNFGQLRGLSLRSCGAASS
jgi:hypothetical protein